MLDRLPARRGFGPQGKIRQQLSNSTNQNTMKAIGGSIFLLLFLVGEEHSPGYTPGVARLAIATEYGLSTRMARRVQRPLAARPVYAVWPLSTRALPFSAALARRGAFSYFDLS